MTHRTEQERLADEIERAETIVISCPADKRLSDLNKKLIVAALRSANPVDEEVVEALQVFERCAYQVAKSINPRGHNWMPEKALDYALHRARAALQSKGEPS